MRGRWGSRGYVTVSGGTLASGWRILGELSRPAFPARYLLRCPTRLVGSVSKRFGFIPGLAAMPSATVLPPPPSREMRPYPARTISAPAPLFLHLLLTPAPTSLQFQNMLRQCPPTVTRVLPPTSPRSLCLDRVSSVLANTSLNPLLTAAHRPLRPCAKPVHAATSPSHRTRLSARRAGTKLQLLTFPECVTVNTTRVRYRVIFLSYACFLS
jgi:hypothetical protein